MDSRSSMGVLTHRAAAYSSERTLACTSAASSFETAVPQVVLCEGGREEGREQEESEEEGEDERERARKRRGRRQVSKRRLLTCVRVWQSELTLVPLC